MKLEPTGHVVRLLRRVATTGLLAIAWPAAQAGAENGALHVWKAVALLRVPRTPEQLQLAEFMEDESPVMTPDIFGARPAAYRWALSDLPALDALLRAAESESCSFYVRREETAGLDLAHLPRLRLLCRRLCGLSLALEYAGQPERAAAAFAALIDLLDCLKADQTLASCLAAADMMQEVLESLEGWVSRAPGPQATEAFVRAMSGDRGTLVSLGPALRAEAEDRVREWTTDPGAVHGLLQRRMGRDLSGEATKAWWTLEGRLKEDLVREWLADYRAEALEMAEALDRPFAEAWPILQRLDARRGERLKLPFHGSNPLLAILLPSAGDIYQRMLLANAQADLAALLCAGERLRAETGRWPGEIAEVARTLGRKVPQDPFSGQPITWQVHRGRLTLGVRIPRKMADRGNWLYTLQPERRRREDEQRTRRAIGRARTAELRELFEPAAP